MCGIVGYVGRREALPIIMSGINRLEYRGYDSAGIAVVNKKGLRLEKVKGKIKQLEKSLAEGKNIHGTLGIAHTRWATHGEPSRLNAHPHTCCGKQLALVHNGIIENYSHLKEWLLKKGHTFTSETDTEVIIHIVEHYYEGDLAEAVRKALHKLKGTYGIALVSSAEPDVLVAAKHGSPLIIGVGERETFIASDVAAVISHTKNVVYM